MCTAAAKTVGSLMAAIEPTLKSILTLTNLANTPQGLAAVTAYDAALAAIQGWKSGTPAQDALQLIGDFQTAFDALPFPPSEQLLVNVILAGVETVIGVLTANSPAPVAPAPVAGAMRASVEETQVMHQAHVIAETTAKVTALVPSFKRSIWHSPASQYDKAWTEAAVATGHPELAVKA
jgi:hypothetical protein